MRHFFEIKDEAAQEAIESFLYYEEKLSGLGERFFNSIEDTYKRIDKNPLSYQKIHKQFRASKVRGFPFIVIYEIAENTIIVYSIFNSFRNPSKKIRK